MAATKSTRKPRVRQPLSVLEQMFAIRDDLLAVYGQLEAIEERTTDPEIKLRVKRISRKLHGVHTGAYRLGDQAAAK